jgi:hypothetical protein
MSAILYGNLSIEIVSRDGARITRMTARQNPLDLLRPQHPEALARPLVLGRQQQSADAFRAIQQGRPIEFYADCGYGKTTLLQHIAASASEWYSASRCVYLRVDRGRVEDLLQQLVAQLYTSEQPVKLTPGECTQLLGQAGLIIAVDDAPADPAQVGYLLEVLSGSSLVLGSARRVAVHGGSSHPLAGLPVDAALSLLAAELGRSLTSQELSVAGGAGTGCRQGRGPRRGWRWPARPGTQRQVCPARLGAGWRPASLRICRTVGGAGL